VGGFELQSELAKRLKKPVRVMNDADVQGYGAIDGKGVEMVLTLGTGAGTRCSRTADPDASSNWAHHPLHGNKTYDQYLGNAALALKVSKAFHGRKTTSMPRPSRCSIVGDRPALCVHASLPFSASAAIAEILVVGLVAMQSGDAPVRDAQGSAVLEQRGAAPVAEGQHHLDALPSIAP